MTPAARHLRCDTARVRRTRCGHCDADAARGIEPLPGALESLRTLAGMRDRVVCGLVTGNVEGIARKKMRAVGVLATGALAPPAAPGARCPRS